MNRETETISKGAKRKNKVQRGKARRFAEVENGRIGRSIAATAMKKKTKRWLKRFRVPAYPGRKPCGFSFIAHDAGLSKWLRGKKTKKV